MRVFWLAISASFVPGACEPGWAIIVANETADARYIRYFDAGTPLVFEIEPGTSGLLGIGNAPGPHAVDVLDASCAYLRAVRVAREGDTVVRLTDSEVVAEATQFPKEISEQQLQSTDRCQDLPTVP